MTKTEKTFKLGPLQKRWVKLLKTQGHLKGTGELGYKRPGPKSIPELCCLGLAGLLVLGNCKWDGAYLIETSSDNVAFLKCSYGELGLFSGEGKINYPKEFPLNPIAGEVENLTELNDGIINGGDELIFQPTPWVDIAYMIEAYPELFFNEPK